MAQGLLSTLCVDGPAAAQINQMGFNMSKFLKLVVASAAVLCMQAHASVIDDFNDATGEISSNAGNGNALIGATTTGGMLGGERDITVQRSGTAGGSVTAEVAGGLFIYGQAGQSVGQATLRWDGSVGDHTTATNTTGLGGVDLTANASAFTFNVFTDGGTIDQGGPLGWIKVEIWGGDGVAKAETLFPAISFTGDVLLSFTDPDWAFSGGFSFASVGAILVTINVDNMLVDGDGQAISLDVELDMIETIPEPTSIALSGLALLGLGALRRRKA